MSADGSDAAASAGGSSVQVVCRLRPLSAKEKANKTLPVCTASTERSEITLVRGKHSNASRHSFVFDRVFGSFSEQSEIFEVVKPIVDDVLGGLQACIFAYGQTGTGK